MGISLPFPIPYGGEIVASVPLILVIVGVLTVIYALIRMKTPGKEGPAETVVGIVTFIIGLTLPIAAGLCILFGVYGVFTAILLVVLSISLVWGPTSRVLKKIPSLALVTAISLALACIIIALIVTFVPIPAPIETIIGPYIKWIVIALFIIIAVLSFTIILFAKGLIELFGTIFGAWPVAIVIGIICIAQGALLALGMSLSQFLEGIIVVPW